MKLVILIFRSGLVVVLLMCASGAQASSLVVDQRFSGTPMQASSIPNLSPIGESFTPTLPGIDWASFLVTDLTALDAAIDGTYAVELLDGFITGPVLGTSGVVTLPSGFGGHGFGGPQGFVGAMVTFDFATRIALIPSHLYTLRVSRTDGSSNFGMLNLTGVLAGGFAWQQGQAFPTANWIFSEGIREAATPVPEPTTLVLVGSAAMVLTRRRRSRPGCF